MDYTIIYHLYRGRRIIKSDIVSWRFEGDERSVKKDSMQYLINHLDHDPFIEGITCIKIVDVKKDE